MIKNKVLLHEVTAKSHIDLANKLVDFCKVDKERQIITIIVTNFYPEVIASIAYTYDKKVI